MEELELYIHSFLTSSLDRDAWPSSRTGHSNPEERVPCTNGTGNWVAPSASMDLTEKRKVFRSYQYSHHNFSSSASSLVTIPTTISPTAHVVQRRIKLGGDYEAGVYADFRLLRLWVRIPPESWMFFYCEWCVLSGRGLCDELITRPEETPDCNASLCVI